MMVVDSNVWAGFFNGVVTPHVGRLDEALRAGEDLAVLPIVVTEVLQGFRSDNGFRRACEVLTKLPVVVPDLGCHVRAAELFRRLRQRGVTVRGAIDCVIAQACIDLEVELLSPDRDFAEVARHSPLRLWRSATAAG